MINIAIVDDEPIFIYTLINIIDNCCNSLGVKHLIDKFSNGYSVLENYNKYHLIFLDIEMPLIDGITIAKKINELKFESEFPYFIFVTSHDELVFEALNSIPYSWFHLPRRGVWTSGIQMEVSPAPVRFQASPPLHRRS